jgi:hypothetical protein
MSSITIRLMIFKFDWYEVEEKKTNVICIKSHEMQKNKKLFQ